MNLSVRQQSKLDMSRVQSQLLLSGGQIGDKRISRRQRRLERKLIREQTIFNLSRALINTDDDDFKNECSLEEGEESRIRQEDYKLGDESNVITPKNFKSSSRAHHSKSHSKYPSI